MSRATFLSFSLFHLAVAGVGAGAGDLSEYSGGGSSVLASNCVESNGNVEQGCSSGLTTPIVNDTAIPEDSKGKVAAEENERRMLREMKYTWPTHSSACGLYLAESTIPNAGLGVYTGINIAKGAEVGFGDTVVTVIDIEWHNDRDDFHFLFDDYEWNAENIGIDNGDRVNALVAGFGAAVNGHPGLVNIEGGAVRHDALGLHRSRDPGAGAFSAFYDRQATSLSPIPAGAEIFLDYGASYFETREDAYGPVPRRDDYQEANDFLRDFRDLVHNHGWQHDTLLLQDMWQLFRQTLPWNSKALAALPRSVSDALSAAEMGIQELLFPSSVRSLEWLQENGKCMDNIRPGLSTIRQAGRGAFATRFIPKGGLVSPSPLVHIPDNGVLRMYSHMLDEHGQEVVNQEDLNGVQLLINYCFGHPSSSLLLCPYGHTTLFVNHAHGDRANAKVVWATDLATHHADWLNRSVPELATEFHAGLAFDYVATRDIQPGEEVFIDYGAHWEMAWQRHVQRFAPPADSKEHVTAWHMNVAHEDYTIPLRTTHEEEYPDSVRLRCLFSDEDLKDTTRGRYLTFDWEDLEEEELLPHACEVLERYPQEDGTFLYDFAIDVDADHLEWDEDDEEEDHDEETEQGYIIQGVPREGFVFYDARYQEDQFLAQAFRYPMMIPDEIFPQAWANHETS